jgi:glucose-6-phosphate 1-epimerase
MPAPPPPADEFDLPDALRVTAGRGGLPCVDIDTPVCRGRQYLLGGSVTDWHPAGFEPVLFTSDHAVYREGQAIRGGVPVCFPWFGRHPSDPDAPSHGLVRTEPWTLIQTSESRDGVGVEMVYPLEPLRVELHACFGPELHLKLKATNLADTDQRFEAALHTYLAVGDVHRVQITGLESSAYLDQLRDDPTCDPTGEPIAFTGEFDRIYHHDGSAVLHDPTYGRRITVEKQGSASTVVWNPWINKSKRMADFGDDEWTRMCCIETANIGDAAVELEPGQTHEMKLKLRVQTL